MGHHPHDFGILDVLIFFKAREQILFGVRNPNIAGILDRLLQELDLQQGELTNAEFVD